MRAWERDHLIVCMQRLTVFARADRDRRQRRDKQPGIEDSLNDLQHGRVDRDPLIEGAVCQQVVDPGGPDPFEQVVGGDDAELLLQATQVGVQGVDEIRLDHSFEHRVALLGDLTQLVFDDRHHLAILRPGVTGRSRHHR